jgi:hypothetical protein
MQPYDNDDDRHGFDQIFNYLHKRNRWGVITTNLHEVIHDFFIIPIESGGKDTLPSFIPMLINSKVDYNRAENMLLLSLVIREPSSTTPPRFPPASYDTRSSESSQAKLPPLAVQILGPFVNAPVVVKMALVLPSMGKLQLENLREVLEREPSTREDIAYLGEYLSHNQLQRDR